MSRWLKAVGITAVAAALLAGLAAFAGSRPSVGDCGASRTVQGVDTYRVQAVDGNCLQGYAWKPAAAPARAVVVLVHGIHDHPGRYDGLARALNAQGIAVLAQDHRGHGASGGARQRVDSVGQLAGDVGLALAEAGRRHPGVPLILYGHSMGGLVAAHVAAGGAARAIVGTLASLAPGLPLEAVDPAQIVREAAAREALARDPAIERGKVPARTIATILGGVVELQPRMPAIRVPLLILHGGADRVTDPAGSRLLAERAGSTEKKLVLVGPALHSLLHEPEGPAVQAEILAFVGARVGPAPRP
jgi:acylglycerol lipase